MGIEENLDLYMLIFPLCVCVCVCRSSFSEFAQRHARDERFKAVEKMREREQLFSDYLQELKKTAAAASSSTGRGRQRGGDRTAHDHTSSPHLKPTDKVFFPLY